MIRQLFLLAIIGATPALAASHTLPAPPYSGAVAADMLLKQPVTTIFPGNVAFSPNIKNPLANDPDAVERGMRDFDRFNCSGCHAANGGGGMGPSLSNSKWIYRADPANIFLTIYQGRPNGMPSWGTMLPDRVIWELVSYVKSISEPSTSFGKTYSKNPQSPEHEQVPAGQITTATPWRFTEPFRDGQKPPG